MTKQQRQRAFRQQKKEWARIQGERTKGISEQFGDSVVRYCSLAINGQRGKGAVKSMGKTTVRHIHNQQYDGGSKVYTRQDGWHSARSWIRKRKFQ